MLYFTLASKAYVRNLQYRAAHLLHNVASVLFGYMYACIWIGIGEETSLGAYGVQGMTSYIAFTQASLWISGFATMGLGIPQSVRTGQIALDLMRPVHLFPHLMSREWGQIAYQFTYKSIPIYLIYFVLFDLKVPRHWSTWLATCCALILAGYLSICINYVIGVTSIWTTESNWLYWTHHALINLLAGFFIPIEWLPHWMQSLCWFMPYPYLLYVPTRIYLELGAIHSLIGSLIWCVLLTLFCIYLTKRLRLKVEVQGG
ncbi:ABC-2 type transport system permease protein [Paenibacillus shirakamiensis]|uniref:ABC-2 type transport system permease protein n=1 Tax=Paenibacillus shirakamiensis TaxID=1265935 RepID=A0ABS4JHL5_9BACL|nr:ABC-2 family transporter protein [Paenibacillus shirakamiensis]MBP2001216.1 ABC-2 type transport system permease protein [Paenibacillus shirakamiensis]